MILVCPIQEKIYTTGWGAVVGKELVNIEAKHILLDAQLSKEENAFLSD